MKDLEWWLDLAPTLDWRFAKSMPQVPHSYVVRGRQLSDEDFERAVRVIRKYGEPGKWRDSVRIYLHDNGVRWWTMGSPLAETTIINVADGSLEDYDPQDGVVRTHSDEHNVYDDLALDYDDRYTSPECQEENAAVRRLINSHFTEYGPKTLDVGCGTGLLLDLKITSPAIYTGIDPSQAMLNELVRKHPKVADLVPGPFGKVWREAQEHGPYDLVVSLFGSASYLHPDQIEALPSFSSDMTVTMTYAEGYWPDYYGEQEPPTAAAAREAALRLTETWGAERLKIGNFDVMVVRL